MVAVGCGGPTFDHWEEMSSVPSSSFSSSSAAPPSPWSWASVVYVVCSSVFVGVAVVVVIEVVGRVGCLRLLLTKLLTLDSHFAPSCAVVTVDSGWSWVFVDVVILFLGWSSLLPVPVLLGGNRWISVGNKLCPASFVVFGNDSSLFQTYPAPCEDPRSASMCSQQFKCFVSCSQQSTHGFSSSSHWDIVTPSDSAKLTRQKCERDGHRIVKSWMC